MTHAAPAKKPGRPRKHAAGDYDTRVLLLRCGVASWSERGFNGTGLEEVLRLAGVPKGSFYHYFKSKDEFAAAVLDLYAAYFRKRLAACFDNGALSPLARLYAFVRGGITGMEKYACRRGCLLGNLGQELASLHEPLRLQMLAILCEWDTTLARCLQQAQVQGQLRASASPHDLSRLFWSGWEGAILRARLQRSTAPMAEFADFFLDSVAMSGIDVLLLEFHSVELTGAAKPEFVDHV